MKLFVYEYVTGGGTWDSAGGADPTGPLLTEGAAMARAVIADLTACGHAVEAMLDARLKDWIELACPVEYVATAGEESLTFARLARQADATLLIAPEIGGALLDRCRRVEDMGGRLISPAAQFVAIAADKQATADCLNRRQVRVPRGMRLRPSLGEIPSSLFPAVLKPRDGAGSWQVTRIDDIDQLRRRLASPELQEQLQRGNLRLERFVPGMAASVAVLCGPQQHVALEPCEQILAEGGFEYEGGRLPLTPPLARRARRLALAAIDSMPKAAGYVGVDLVLGAVADGSEDYVIEVNPRLTTSYVGLRAACRQNLGAAMLDVAAGRAATLSFRQEPVEFRSDGTILPVLQSNV